MAAASGKDEVGEHRFRTVARGGRLLRPQVHRDLETPPPASLEQADHAVVLELLPDRTDENRAQMVLRGGSNGLPAHLAERDYIS